jgi:photosystem II S4 domain protein
MESPVDRLQGGPPAADLEPVLEAAERCLRTWEPVWTGFLDGALREAAEARLGALSDLRLDHDGGHGGAERCRLLLQRSEAALPLEQVAGDFAGLEIAGNFLFDPADPADFRAALLVAGALPEELGDVWVRGDRGAQAITAHALAARLHGQPGRVRTVEVRFEARPLAELQLPPRRVARSFSTVEASTRLDAVASAGVGLSRSRMAALIRQGAVRIDWRVVTSPSRELRSGERVQLEGRGELRIEAVEITKRDRCRIRLLRS